MWTPGDRGELEKLERVLWTFTSNIHAVKQIIYRGSRIYKSRDKKEELSTPKYFYLDIFRLRFRIKPIMSNQEAEETP